MAKAGDVLEMEPLGVRLKLLQTAEDTGGELLDRKLLRLLTPLLRPLFRWNHNWAIARAMEGLEPYARSTSPDTQVTQPPPTQMVPSGSREM